MTIAPFWRRLLWPLRLLRERLAGTCAECGEDKMRPCLRGVLACDVCGRWRKP